MGTSGELNKMKLFFVITLLLAVIIESPAVFCQEKDSTANKALENQMKTIIRGMNSTNSGLARSSIYMVGYYAFPWAADPLIEIMNDTSKDISIRILAAYSLDMLGIDKSREAIRLASVNDNNDMLQKVCGNLYRNYLNKRDEILYTGE